MTTEDSDLADTYALIYSFLTERSHFKAAKAVKKAAKGGITITGSQDGPSLPLIVKQWRKFAADPGGKVASSVKSARLESSSSDASPNSSEDSESSSEESSASGTDPEVNLQSPKESAQPKTEIISSKKVSDPESDGGASSSLDSDPDSPLGEEARGVALGVTEEPARAGKSLASTSLNRTDSDTSKPLSDEGDDAGSEARSASSDDSSSISCSDTDSDNSSISGRGFGQGGCKLRRKEPMNMAGEPALSPSRNPGGAAVASKKRRTDERGSSVVTSVGYHHSVSDFSQRRNGRNLPRKINTPFSRIKVGEIKFADERLKDNTFESRMATSTDYGAKANADLVVTRGASFRREKNKKKRGSYRGGEITMESHSIKFAS